MTNSSTGDTEMRVSGGTSRRMQCGVLGAVCAVVIGVYVVAAQSGPVESVTLNSAADAYYNLLVQGFRAGQLSLKKDAPPGLAHLADPYDPAANSLYLPASNSMIDMSYFKGKLYLYFGVTPVLILFWPYTTLTGHYLFHRQAVAIFCALGFLASVGLLDAIWRRYFAAVSLGVVAACVVALGLATGLPVLLTQSDVYEVPISCGYMLVMLALGALWRALHEPERGWPGTLSALALASVAYGLAVGARPSLLFGAVILLVPVIQAWRQRRPIGALLLAATGPIILIGLGLMLYNALRFESPFEFGWHYALGPVRQDTLPLFSVRYLWFNFRVYFLEPARWSGGFPFVHETALPPLPPGHHGLAGKPPFGVLTNVPLVWLALVVPLAWRGRSPRLSESGSILREFLAAVTVVLGAWALTVGALFAVAMRFEVEFLPALVLLAVVGILGLERALSRNISGWRHAVRWGWGLLLGFSVAFNLLVGIESYAEARYYIGNNLVRAGRIPDAIQHYEQAVRFNPDLAKAHNNLGAALWRAGRIQEAIGQFEEVLRITPESAEAHNNLGAILAQVGKITEAIAHYEQALRIKPDYADAHNNLGVALEQAGQIEDAIAHYEQSLRLSPDDAATRSKLQLARQTLANRQPVGARGGQ